ncbi:ABC transporter permease [Pedobacter metabolipauper]|uniref:Putative permease n=1 Tax=Pedobacter metabolipauper TaxID=425513 RepID=A0A4R6SVH0_9SPHI|nr:ABC transporter permease [Pedobacter metabolipauper]TDQ08361.1 putative permease [Pedobacter metabolipauper]
MFKLNLKIALRNLWKNKGYTLINILGLSIGMASCILIFIFIRFQLSFDEGYRNEDRIYRIVSKWEYPNGEDFSQGVPIPLAAAARNDFAGIEKVAAVQRSGGIVNVKDESGKDVIKSDERIYYTQPDFFEIFDVKWLFGNPKQTLTDPNQAALSQSIATRFFGSAEKAVGKNITFNKKDLKITGVFKDMPENSSLPFQIVASYATFSDRDSKSWGHVSSRSECYMMLKEGVAIKDLDGPMDQFNKKYYKDNDEAGRQLHGFQHLRDIHFNERYGNYSNTTTPKSQLYGLAIIGCFLIITACINFINLATAQAVSRSKEVGVRKVMGSKRKQLIVQFLSETLTISLMALLIACVLTEFALPHMQQLFDNKISFSLFEHPVIFVFLTVLVFIVSTLAGFYPALVMSGFSPALAIKNKVSVNSGSLSLRKILVVVQFAITIILIIGTLVILNQMEYVRKKPLGFNSGAVAIVYAPGDSLSRLKYNTFKERVLQIPGVQGLSYCQIAPLSGDVSEVSFSFDGKDNKDFQIRKSAADENYFKLFDLKLIAGKVFLKSDTLNGYVVNEMFLKKLNIKNPQDAIGKLLSANDRKAPIVGVMKDFNDLSLKQSISPLVIYPEKSDYYNMAIRVDEKEMMPAMKKVEALWSTTFSDYIYDGQFVDDSINSFYDGERITGTLFKVFAGVIIFISFIGLFGLISYVATQRSREVAIRKVLGASTYDLVKMLNGSFLLMVFIANLVAWPLAYIFVSKWLSGFVYRIDLSIWPFIIAMFISMAITLITVSLRSYRAASANTIDALKYE